MPLTRDHIVAAAIDLLDERGERGLTYPVLAARLATGSGAIYWHVTNKDDLIAAASLSVVARELPAAQMPGSSAHDGVREVALAAFDSISSHPWVGAHLANPLQPAALLLFDRFGSSLGHLDLPADRRFNTASALMSFVLGLAGQYAAGARLAGKTGKRSDLLADIAGGYERLDPAQYPYLHTIGPLLMEHDDRAQFLDGIDLILAGLQGSLT